jgi:hypothetical protein
MPNQALHRARWFPRIVSSWAVVLAGKGSFLGVSLLELGLYHETKTIVLRTVEYQDANMVYQLPPSERTPNTITSTCLVCRET